MTLPEPLMPFFNKPCSLSLEIPAIDKSGTYNGTVAITEVNGEPNSNTEPAAAPVHVMSFVPRKTVVMEEYTGTWCGWCPRGAVSLEHMSRDIPDTFIGVAYHQRDVMSCVSVTTPGLPCATLDRGAFGDPGYYEVYPRYAELCSQLPVAEISVEAAAGEDAVTCTATTTFIRDMDHADYRIAYLLVADGLKGEGPDWEQTNYYSGLPEEQQKAWLEKDPELAPYIGGTDPMTDVAYDHVLVYTKDRNGLPGSVPAVVKADEAMKHTVSIPKASVKNDAGEPLLQAGASYSVVALLIDNATGAIENAAQCPVVGEMVSAPAITAPEGPTHYYDLAGRRVTSPHKGLYIRVRDGRVSKVAL